MGSMIVLNKSANVKIATRTFMINTIRTPSSHKNEIKEIE